MSDFEIKPPVGPAQQPATGPEGAEGSSQAIGADAPEAAGPASGAATDLDPAALVAELQAGQLDFDTVLEILVDQALQTPVVAEAPEELRQQLRGVLLEMIRDDPTLAELASAMER